MTEGYRAVVLDTRAISALLDARKPDHGDAQRALGVLLAARAADTAEPSQALFIVPALVVYEVRRGLLKRGNRRLLMQFDRLLRNHARVEPFDELAADRAAEEWVARTRAGKTPGELDLLIAVTGAVLGADVVTADDGFPEPAGVRLRRWADFVGG